MIKKTILLLTLMSSLYIFTACDMESLDEYKGIKTVALQEYSDEKGEIFYSASGWMTICQIVDDGIVAIENSSTKSEVSKAFANAKNEIDAVEIDGNSDLMKNGAYFITDSSWEMYIRLWAEINADTFEGIDEKFIQKAIAGTLEPEDIDGFLFFPPQRESMWVVVYGEQVTVSRNFYDIYQISRVGNKYEGCSLHSSIDLVLKNDLLLVREGTVSLQYKRDNSFQSSEDVNIKFSRPANVSFSCGGEGANYAFFMWYPNSNSGWFGAGIEIFKANSSDYVLTNIDSGYMNIFIAQFTKSDFTQGINYVRFYYLGGPSLDYSTKQIYIIPSSEYVTFEVIIDIEGNISINEV